MKAPLSYIPAFPAMAGLVAGILLRVMTPFGMWAGIGALVAGGVLMLLRQKWWAFMAWFAVVGVILTHASMPKSPPEGCDGRRVVATCHIEKAEEKEESMYYVADVTDVVCLGDSMRRAADFKMALTVADMNRVFKPGDIVLARGVIQRVQTSDDLPDQTDYSRYMEADGVGRRMFAEHDGVSPVCNNSSACQRFAYNAQRMLHNAVIDAGFSPQTTDFLLATIAGDTHYLTQDLETDFRTAGLAHILALSGLHVSILIGLAMALIYMVRIMPAGRYIYYFLPIVLVWFYAVATGMSPSVCRAAVMVTVFLTGKALEIRSYAYNSLCVTVLIWLMVNPFWLFLPGFQLSVVAVGALIWTSEYIMTLPLSRRWQKCLMVVAIPISAVVATSLLTILYFRSLPVCFLPANVMASVFVAPLMVIGAIGIMFSACGVYIAPLIWLEDRLCEWFEQLVHGMASLPGGSLGPFYPDAEQMVLWALVVIAAGWGITRHKRRGRIMIWGTAVILVMMLAITNIGDNPMHKGAEVWLTRDRTNQRIVVRVDENALLISPTSPTSAGDILGRVNIDYADYLGRRGCGETFEVADGDFDLGDVARCGHLLIMGRRLMTIANTDTVTFPADDNVRVDYMLLCGRFKGDAVKAAFISQCDTAVLGADLNAIRRRRYAAELSEAGIPVLDLSQQPLHILIR